jgi:hypothetical protein
MRSTILTAAVFHRLRELSILQEIAGREESRCQLTPSRQSVRMGAAGWIQTDGSIDREFHGANACSESRAQLPEAEAPVDVVAGERHEWITT